MRLSSYKETTYAAAMVYSVVHGSKLAMVSIEGLGYTYCVSN
jgi:hypothetical protein